MYIIQEYLLIILLRTHFQGIPSCSLLSCTLNETSGYSFGRGQYTMDNPTPFKLSSQWHNGKFKHTPPVWLVPTVRLTYISVSKHGGTFPSGKCLCHCAAKWILFVRVNNKCRVFSFILMSISNIFYL